MRLLLDTHALFWSVEAPSKLSAAAMAAMQDPANERLLSAATIWELAIKVGQRKIALSIPNGQWMATAITDLKLNIMPTTVEYAERQSTLPAPIRTRSTGSLSPWHWLMGFRLSARTWLSTPTEFAVSGDDVTRRCL